MMKNVLYVKQCRLQTVWECPAEDVKTNYFSDHGMCDFRSVLCIVSDINPLGRNYHPNILGNFVQRRLLLSR